MTVAVHKGAAQGSVLSHNVVVVVTLSSRIGGVGALLVLSCRAAGGNHLLV